MIKLDKGRRHSRDGDEGTVEKDAVGNENRQRTRTPSAAEEAEVKKEDHIPERRDLAKTRGGKLRG